MLTTNTHADIESGILQIKDPITGELLTYLPPGAKESDARLPVTLTLAGPNHPQRKKIEFQRARLLRNRVSKKGRFELTDPEEDSEYAIDRLVASTLGWAGFADGAQPIEFSAAAVEKFYLSLSWLRDQANEYLDEKTNFLKSARTV
jgi:hypothetical protein